MAVFSNCIFHDVHVDSLTYVYTAISLIIEETLSDQVVSFLRFLERLYERSF